MQFGKDRIDLFMNFLFAVEIVSLLIDANSQESY